jgi:hypothetical protein
VIEHAFIQVNDDGDFPNVPLHVAARGFGLRGRDVVRMTADEIAGRSPRPEDLVLGGAHVVREYLGRMGIEPPDFDYPEALVPFLRRKFEIDTLGVIRRRYNGPGDPVFIKPVEHKLFTGHVVSRFRDLLKSTEVDSTTLVYVVGHVEFVSEWRFYVEEGRVVGADHYRGEPLLFPEPGAVAAAAAAMSGYEDAPVTYGLDFGVCSDGVTRLVEANDMFALGTYGLDGVIYSHLVERRWEQLVAPVPASDQQSET